METRKIIDILNSRNVENVTAWLKKFPNIKIVSRDGSYIYAKAIYQAHPNAQQVSDYFHLVKNLSEYLNKCLLRKLPKIITVEDQEILKLDINILKKKELYSSEWEFAEVVKKLYFSGKRISEISNMFNLQYRSVKRYIEMTEEKYLKSVSQKNVSKVRQEKKQELVRKTKELYLSGKTFAYIKEELGLAYETAKKYIDSTEPLIHKTPKRINSIEPYKKDVIDLLNKRVKKQEIYKFLKEKGYNQALRTFYRNIEKIIDEQKDNIENDKEIKTISVISKIKALNFLKLLYLPIENIKELTQSTYNQIILKYPRIEEVLDIMKEFKTLVKEQNLIKYIFWLEKIKILNIPELNSFIKSVERDNDAIINAIYYRYTNGLAEGFVNKLKTIKRSMYGKATFQGLRRKILWAERGYLPLSTNFGKNRQWILK